MPKHTPAAEEETAQQTDTASGTRKVVSEPTPEPVPACQQSDGASIHSDTGARSAKDVQTTVHEPPEPFVSKCSLTEKPQTQVGEEPPEKMRDTLEQPLSTQNESEPKAVVSQQDTDGQQKPDTGVSSATLPAEAALKPAAENLGVVIANCQ